MRGLLAFAVVVLGAACAERPPPSPTAGAVERITIDVGPTVEFCLSCFDRVVTVARDGRIEATDRMDTSVSRWRVSSRLSAQFFATMATVRPVSDRDFGGPCAETEGCVRDFAYVITWEGPGRTVRLRANGPRPQRVYCTLSRARQEIGIDYSTGRRARPRPALLGSNCDPDRMEGYER